MSEETRPAGAENDIREDHRAYMVQLRKVRKISILVTLRGGIENTQDARLSKTQQKLYDDIQQALNECGIRHVPWTLFIGEREEHEAAPHPNEVRHVDMLEAGETAHRVHIQAKITQLNCTKAAAISCRMCRIETLADGGKGVVETVEPDAAIVMWPASGDEYEAIAPTIKKFVHGVLDRIQTGEADLEGEDD